MKKIVKILTISIVLMIIVSNISLAVDFSKANDFITKGSTNAPIGDLSEIGAEFSEMGNVLKFIGAGIIVAATAYMGIMYMISPPERQAKLKQQLIGLAISAAVIFGGYYIWQIIVMALENITNITQ